MLTSLTNRSLTTQAHGLHCGQCMDTMLTRRLDICSYRSLASRLLWLVCIALLSLAQ